jgi:hypothetical protein
MICLLFLCPDFDLHSGDEIATYTCYATNFKDSVMYEDKG